MNNSKIVVSLVMAISIFWVGASEAKTSKQSDDQIRQLIIEDSIASYPGVCACPFNAARNGSSCGRRSAWSKQGGYAPVCYKKEISKEMVDDWRNSHDA
ncbi:hypothetical protein ABEH00_19635 [Pantoea agglomerans]|jgi:hypothetical protein|nr:hypothetical protein [Pantoea agglomerans]EZI33150.1 hypothetical protein BW31_02604 [Pantoea agglomerans]KYM71219.1 hypothetical protein A3L21_18760 [Pantoea agglomerans]MBD8262316.1 hypothetical protein [Pantoea agglomerans]TCZ30564.1 hypothetical protein EYB39_05965 [Pantoea agglomerans]WNK60404.1 hypothetical protein RM151_19915 [Pantoea agglomerans]